MTKRKEIFTLFLNALRANKSFFFTFSTVIITTTSKCNQLPIQKSSTLFILVSVTDCYLSICCKTLHFVRKSHKYLFPSENKIKM